MASIHQFCCCKGAPCVDCNPGGAGSTPNDADVSGVDNDTGSWCEGDKAIAYETFTQESDYCTWKWTIAPGGLNAYTVYVHYCQQDATTITLTSGGDSCSVTLDAGEWAVFLHYASVFPNADTVWAEETTGFACSGGAISGTHTFVSGARCASFDDDCGGTPTVTVDP